MTDAGVLLVTGASRGIGAATARLGAARGYAVCVNYNSGAARADEVVSEIRRTGGRAVAVQADVSEPAAVSALFEGVDRELGPVTALVNNAGIIGGVVGADEISAQQIARVFAVNTFSYMYCAGEALRRMSRKHGGAGGAIVNVSSRAAAFGGLPLECHYAATKGAIESWTKGLAREVGKDGVRVNCVRPGPIATDIHLGHGGMEVVHRVGASGPAGRAGSADEVAEAILWLLSPASSYVVGSVLDVTGGL